MNSLIILLGKLIVNFSRLLNLGNGSTWPGHIALSLNPNFIKELRTKNKELRIILIAGTNGKTTTGKLIQTILEKNGKKVFQNTAGANLLNGIASSLIFNSNLSGKINKDFAVFEIDENTLPLILKEINNPDFIVIMNLFRDQLDRYGEVNTIARKWSEALKTLGKETKLILNADDPQVAYLEKSNPNSLYFGVNSKNKTEKAQHASDSTNCPNCGEKLTYKTVYFSHLGDWSCKKCGLAHPQKTFNSSPVYPLPGAYNEYNTNAAVLITQTLGLDNDAVTASLKDFKPAFGRQEILEIDGKKVQIFLSKNPTGFNESLKTISNLNAKNLLILLNDRIPDGRDVSWIWDIDFEDFSSQFKNVTVSGDRTFDMGLRLKYAEFKNYATEEDLSKATQAAIDKTPAGETLYILATYSAMLEVRKILTGKKIL